MTTSRRSFLKSGVLCGASLIIPFRWPSVTQAASGTARGPLTAWLRMGGSGRATLFMPKAEMGQGVMTALPMILAEELEIDWKDVTVEQAPTDPATYRHGTGGSSSIRSSFLPLRQAAAAGRTLLVQAAATRWQVDAARCRAAAGAILGPSGQRLPYAEVIAEAAQLPVPDLATVLLKDPADFKILGRSIPRVDIPSKVDGTARFGIDVKVPGRLVAVVQRCATFGGRPKTFDATQARAVPGVRDVLEIEAVAKDVFSAGGVAVVAESTWAAMKGRQALTVEWEHGPGRSESSEGLFHQFAARLERDGELVRNEGNAPGALAGSHTSVDATYELPFEAHATMEPMNATVDVRPGSVEAWVPTQDAAFARQALAQLLERPPETITVHTTLLGGGFGRRSSVDFVVEAAQISRAMRAPVQVVWSREDDLQHDFYRPASLHALKGGLDENRKPVAWWHRISSTSIAAFQDPPETAKPAQTEVGGAVDFPYAVPAIRVEYSPIPSRVPVSWWRSVDNSFNAFAVESFMDELAAAARIDPLAFRLDLLKEPRVIQQPPDWRGILETARLRAVLERVGERASWGRSLSPGRAQGVACHFSYRTYVAQVAEVSVQKGEIRVHRVHVVVDCGRALNPDTVRAQMEGGVVYGLSAALKGGITVASGQVQQSNFHDYDVLRLPEMPVVDVEILESDRPPTGVGEPGVPPIAPAVANAVHALTGQRLRRLPLRIKG